MSVEEVQDGVVVRPMALRQRLFSLVVPGCAALTVYVWDWMTKLLALHALSHADTHEAKRLLMMHGLSAGTEQAEQLLAMNGLGYGNIEILPNFLYFDLAFNRGAAFSMFSAHPEILAILAAILTVVIGIWIWRVALTQKLTAFSLSLVLGGALGNLIDRIPDQAVTDFIRVHFAVINWSWPTFNIADSAICIGMAILLYTTFFPGKEQKE